MKHLTKSSKIASIVLILTCAFVFVTAVQTRIDPLRLYYDVQTIGALSEHCCKAYDGTISTLGIMLWSATSAIALFCALLFHANSARTERNFAFHVGALSAWLAIDDAYLLHEIVLPRLGVPQLLVLASIGFALIALVVLYRAVLANTAWWVLAVSIMAFAISALVDVILPGVRSTWLVIEDGSKLIGIVAWCFFFVDAFLRLLVHGCLQKQKMMASSARE